jgi:hypothetical protein
MSEFNANVIVESISLDVSVNQSNIDVSVDPINLNLFAYGYGSAGGNTTELQYNGGGILNGIPTATFNGSNLSLGDAANLKITGGNNAFYLQTDGTGNLTWSAGTGNITGNGSVGGTNTQVQFNDGGLFGGDSGLVYNKTSDLLTVENVNVSSITNLFGLTKIYEVVENVAIIGAQTGTYNYDLLNGAIQYSTANATANLSLNFRGNSATSLNSVLSTGQSITGTYIITLGSSAGVGQINAVSVDGAAQAVAYAGNIQPTTFSYTTTAYTYTIIKTGSATYKVLGSFTRYG